MNKSRTIGNYDKTTRKETGKTITMAPYSIVCVNGSMVETHYHETIESAKAEANTYIGLAKVTLYFGSSCINSMDFRGRWLD